MDRMTKSQAFALLECEGPTDLADLLGMSVSAISQWPDPLSRSAEDRVLAEAYRRRMEGGRCENCND